MSCVMRSPSCSQTFRSWASGACSGILDQQVVQQQPAALHVAARLLHELQQRAVLAAGNEAHLARICLAPSRPARDTAFTQLFTTRSRVCNGCRSSHVSCAPWWLPLPVPQRARQAETLHAGELEIRPDEGLVLARGRALTLSVREFELLVALARARGPIVGREDLYRSVWGGELRARRPLGRRVREQAPQQARGGASGPAASSTPTPASATASSPSLHKMFTWASAAH